MIDILGEQLDYVFFAFGLAFVLMATTGRALGWSPGSKLPWKWLG